MSLTIITQPSQYMAGYSAVPLKVYDPNYNNYTSFKYIVNIVWDKRTISLDTPYSLGSSVYTKLDFTSPHEFKIGDTVLLDDTINLNKNTGYFNVKDVLSTTSVLIDLIPNSPFINSGSTLSKVIKYNISPDLDGYGKVDLGSVLKDFVSYDITGQTNNYSLSYEGTDTRFCYEIFCGEEYNYSVDFQDNLFLSGSVGFYNTGITSLNGVAFQVGDQILIQQDIVEWNYADNYFSGGAVGFTGTTQHSFKVGQQINITGQQTFPYYNGTSTILSASTYSVVIDKTFQGSSPVEPGKIYGVPRPEYNTTAIITAIYIDPTYGLVIKTNLPFTTSSVPIPGKISYASGQIYTQPIQVKTTSKCVFNSFLNQSEFTMTAYNQYVLTGGTATNKHLSTILYDDECYRVEPSTIGFILTHLGRSIDGDGSQFFFYDDNGNLLGSIKVPKPAGTIDYYTPFGLQQLSQTTYTNVSGTFSSYSGSVSNYEMFCYLGANLKSQRVCFFVNQDCSMYEMYHLLWVDKLGSIVSMPFIYVSRSNIEVQRNNYYQQEGNWDGNTFGYRDYDRGEKSFYTQSRKSLILNSGFLKDFETDLIEDMMQSISVWVQTPSNHIYSAQIAIDAVELYKNINEQIFQYSMNVRYSVNENRF